MPRFPGEFYSPSAPPPSSSISFTSSSPPLPPPTLFLFFILYGAQPVFRPWSLLSSFSTLLSSLLIFSSSVSMALIQTKSSHLHLGFPMVFFPLKLSSITALGMRVIHPYCVASPLYHIITVAHYFVYHVICDLFLCKISTFTLEIDPCLIFEGVKRLSCSLAHRLHCV